MPLHELELVFKEVPHAYKRVRLPTFDAHVHRISRTLKWEEGGNSFTLGENGEYRISLNEKLARNTALKMPQRNIWWITKDGNPMFKDPVRAGTYQAVQTAAESIARTLLTKEEIASDLRLNADNIVKFSL